MTLRAVDDPLTNLELLAAGCVLARQLYEARGEAFGLAGIWTMLNAAERQVYIDKAVSVLRSVAPATVVKFPETHL